MGTRTRIYGKPLSQLRTLASEEIYKAMGKAPVVVVKYGKEGAMAWCQWQDGLREYMYVDYSALAYPEGQHERAMQYISRIG